MLTKLIFYPYTVKKISLKAMDSPLWTSALIRDAFRRMGVGSLEKEKFLLKVPFFWYEHRSRLGVGDFDELKVFLGFFFLCFYC